MIYYLLGIFLPPLAVFLTSKSLFQTTLNILLSLFIIPGIIHALIIVRKAKKKSKKELEIKMEMSTKNNNFDLNEKYYDKASGKKVEIEPFEKYYPNIEDMDEKQKMSYAYLVSKLENGIYPDVNKNISYLFVYVYKEIDKLSEKPPRNIIETLQNLRRGYKKYENLSEYLSNWIGDLYCLIGDFDEAINNYYKLIDVSGGSSLIIDRIINVKYHKDFNLSAKETIAIADNLTDFGKEHYKEVIKYCNEELESERKEIDKKYLKYIGDKYFDKLESYPFTLFNGFPGEPPIEKYIEKNNIITEKILFQQIEELLEFTQEITRKAENKSRKDKGIAKVGEGWVSETDLYYKVKDYVEKYNVIHHYTSSWLGKQHLDIFIPELDLAIEYHGRQHFEPVEFFGGEEAFKKQKKRDAKKKTKCEKNDVKLVSLNPDYDFSEVKEIIDSRKKAIETQL